MLKRQVVVITGGSSGIGSALARLLAGEDATIVIAGRRLPLLKEVSGGISAAGGKCKPVQCDVTRKNEAENLIHSTVKEFGGIDVLVNNAGRGHFASVEDTTDEMIQSMFAVNVFSLWYTTRPALSYMKKQGKGHVINVASMAGKLGYPYNSAYVAAKHACVGFTHALRQELLETGIHATVVCPAAVDTDWAASTEGGSMLPFFSESGPRIKKIAAERGLKLPPIEGLKSPESVAEQIVECIRHPVAEVFTHTGSKEFAILASQDREEAERFQLPIVLGERETYLKNIVEQSR
jgi:NAD(P)-dependent dehydrogenase (short-subunit alcohol dehydrogenase family)